jgi:hypothetical protein
MWVFYCSYTSGGDTDEPVVSGIRGESFGLDELPTNGWQYSTKRVSIDYTTSKATISNTLRIGDRRHGVRVHENGLVTEGKNWRTRGNKLQDLSSLR